MSFDASLAFCYSCDSVVSILRKNELIRAQKSLKVFLKGWKSSPNITITSKNSSSFLSVGDNNVVISNENLLNLANNKKPTDFSLVGLKNLGNTCYFNSLLQNLANLRPLVFYLTSTHEKDLLIQSSPLSSIGDRPVGEFTSTLSSFFKLFCDTANCKSGLLESRDRIIDPSKLFGLVEKASSYFKKNQQGDAHKLFRLILELLISEEKQSRLNILKSSDSTHLENSTTSSLSTLVGAIFEGKLLHVVKCLSCHEEYSTEEPFYDIHISLSKADHFVDRGTGRKNFIIKSNKAKGNGVSRCSDSSVVLPLCSSIAADKAESGGISQFFVRDLDGSLLTIRVKDNYTTSELQKAVTEQRKKLLFERNKNFNMSSSVNLSFLQLLISNQPTLKTSSPLDLYCLLRHYFKVEKLRGCNQYACSNCTRVHHSSSSKSAEWEDSSESVKAAEGQPTILVDAVRQSAILTLPHVLTIAIKRFAFCDADFRNFVLLLVKFLQKKILLANTGMRPPLVAFINCRV
ncbi:uncharacterized protein LOC135121289 [Zophobas morio]|uniref:uncharacterized protein LOC135121289 n=1 Tax=Zophobas morio TaxID=2755281 RepID=UPI0030828792